MMHWKERGRIVTELVLPQNIRRLRKTTETLRIVGVPSGIQTANFPNASQQSSPLGPTSSVKLVS
jgi:hypothetical protein